MDGEDILYLRYGKIELYVRDGEDILYLRYGKIKLYVRDGEDILYLRECLNFILA